MRSLTVFLLLILSGSAAWAQRGVDVKGSIGLASFVDESAENHLLAGGSVRIYLTRRFAFEPEVLYLRQSSLHSDIALLPNLVWDFRTGRVVPYVTGGVGLLRSTWKAPALARDYTNNQLYLSAGGGVKLYATERFFLAPEFRVGTELDARVSVGVGYTFGR